MEVNLLTTERRSHPAPVGNHRPLALRAVWQITFCLMPSFLPSASLPLHELLKKSVSQELWHCFCSCGVSNKHLSGLKVHSSEEVHYRKLAKIHLSIKGALFVLPPLLLCASLSQVTSAEYLLFGVQSALAQPSSTGYCIQREHHELLLKQLSSFMTTTFELRACLAKLSMNVPLQSQFIRC